MLETVDKELLKLVMEKNRRATFKKWVFSDTHRCNASKMAEAGFIFIGSKEEPDAVKCFFCNKSLDGWEPEDDPWEEHLKHAPYCSFAKLQQPEDTLTFYQFVDLKNEYVEVLIKRIFDAEKEKMKNYYEECLKLVSSLEVLNNN